MARSLRRRGARVAVMARSAEKLEAVARETEGVAIPGDVTREEDRRRAVDVTVSRLGRIDILINNAGVGMYVPAWKADMKEVRNLYELNLFAVLGFIQLVTPLLQKQNSGAIVNVSSIAGKVALPWFSNYTASKFAVSALTDTLRAELAPWGIHCMTLCPGYVKTGFQEHALAGRPPDRLWSMKKFAITADRCAEACIRGLERDKRTVIVPYMGRWLQIAYVLAPGIIDRQLARIYRNLKME